MVEKIRYAGRAISRRSSRSGRRRQDGDSPVTCVDCAVVSGRGSFFAVVAGLWDVMIVP